MITGSGLLTLLLYLVVAGVIAYILFWAIGYVGLPEPFDKVARVVVVLIIVLMLIGLLANFAGHPIIRW